MRALQLIRMRVWIWSAQGFCHESCAPRQYVLERSGTLLECVCMCLSVCVLFVLSLCLSGLSVRDVVMLAVQWWWCCCCRRCCFWHCGVDRPTLIGLFCTVIMGLPATSFLQYGAVHSSTHREKERTRRLFSVLLIVT